MGRLRFPELALPRLWGRGGCASQHAAQDVAEHLQGMQAPQDGVGRAGLSAQSPEVRGPLRAGAVEVSGRRAPAHFIAGPFLGRADADTSLNAWLSVRP